MNVTSVASRTGVEISHKPKHPQGCPCRAVTDALTMANQITINKGNNMDITLKKSELEEIIVILGREAWMKDSVGNHEKASELRNLVCKFGDALDAMKKESK